MTSGESYRDWDNRFILILIHFSLKDMKGNGRKRGGEREVEERMQKSITPLT